MLPLLIAVIMALYFLGYLNVSVGLLSVLKIELFRFFGHPVTLLMLLMFLTILWVLEALPYPLRQVAILLFVLWVLSVLGIVAIVWTTHFVVIALVVLLFLAIVMGG